MPRFPSNEEEITQFGADPVATLARDNWVLFDLRRLSMRLPIFCPANEWTTEHLVMLACLTAKDVPMERIVPAKYLPPSEDAELQRAFREVEIAFRYPSADSDFRGLPKAIADLGSATGLLHGGEAILHSFCSGVSSKFEGSRLRKDLSIQHMIGSTAPLRWYMGGSVYPWRANSSGYMFLESTIEGKTLQGPLVTQSIYTEAPEQLAVMVAIASGFCGFTGILEGQDVYQLTLDKPAILRINHIHFHTRHIKDLLHADSLPAELYPLHLRRSIPFDLSKPEEVKQAAWALMGLMRYLQSGEAEISILKHSMRSESAEGTSESEVMKQLARFGLDGNRGRLGLKRSPPYRHRYLNCSTGSK